MGVGRDLREVWTLGGLSPRALAVRVYRQINADDVWNYAAQLAFYFLFAIFPFFIFLTALLAYVPIPDLMGQLMEVLGDIVPEQVLAIIEKNLAQLLAEPRGGLLSFGILLSLWLASSAFAAITNSLNRAYGVSESRPFWKVRGMAIVLTVGLAVMIIVSMALLIFGPELGGFVAERLGVGGAFDLAWNLIRWPVIVALMILGAALIYYFAPDVEQAWRWITPGSVFAVLAWIPVSLLFGLYVEHFGDYNRTYGSIGAIIMLLSWMYLSGFFLLVGGEINAEIEDAAAGGKNRGEKRLPDARTSAARPGKRRRRPARRKATT